MPQEQEKQAPPRSMHEDVPTWCDTCSCEPEPRWQQVAEELAGEQARRASTSQ